eukprot:CAMPEP_0118927152 /NCGR_PEP_ID=MMETSP1169-20130426/4683_1 /TAXON_ID=36882 /ORGANISM="Pyramimonas obovata, Strain CCMP722" /LENGTH=1094 /DNA_ID=CAMNT_0006868857 /DNA_START=516 /DNA_END=3797 /DNA_ORIENTATION=-
MSFREEDGTMDEDLNNSSRSTGKNILPQNMLVLDDEYNFPSPSDGFKDTFRLSGNRRREHLEAPSKHFEDASLNTSLSRDLIGLLDWRLSLCEILDNVFVQSLLFSCVVVALLAKDVAISFSASDDEHRDLDWTLFAVLIFLGTEFVLNIIAKPNYVGSFYFWMDLIGTASIVTDIQFIADGLLDDHSDALQVSRAARVASKAGRLTRVLKMLRVLRYFFDYLFKPANREANKDQLASSGQAPSSIGESLSNAVSYQITSLLLLTILVVPLLTSNTTDTAPDAFASLFYNAYNRSLPYPLLETEAQEFFQHFAGTSLKPVELRIGNSTFPRMDWYNYTSYSKDKYTVEKGPIFLGFNASEKNKENALLNILFALYVMLALVIFAGLLNAKTSELVVRPLENIFNIIQEHAAHLMVTLDTDLRHQNVDKALTKVSKLLKKIVHNKHGDRQDQARQVVQTYIEEAGAEVDAETKAWLINMTEMEATIPDNERLSVSSIQKSIRGPTMPAQPSRLSIATQAKVNIMNSTLASHPILAQPDLRGLIKLMAEEEKSAEMLINFDRAVIKESHFDVFAYDKFQLFLAVYYMFEDLDLLDDLSLLPVDVFWPFMRAVHTGYRDNEYHNFFHCVDVTQTVYRTLHLTDARMRYSPLEKYSIMVAAICHDMDHPGVSNAFLVHNRAEVAMLYNDSSVLENRHISALYALCNNPETDIFKKLDAHEWREARKIIISTVLHTDMIHHFEMVTELEAFLAGHREALAGGKLDMRSLKPAERQFVLNVILHAADISNPVKPFIVYNKWADCVLREFFKQGDQERAKEMAVSPMMDRYTTSVGMSQINFIEFVVSPLYWLAIQMLPELSHLMRNLIENRLEYGKVFDLEICSQDWLTKSNKTQAQREEDRRIMHLREEKFREKYCQEATKEKPQRRRVASLVLNSSTCSTSRLSGSEAHGGEITLAASLRSLNKGLQQQSSSQLSQPFRQRPNHKETSISTWPKLSGAATASRKAVAAQYGVGGGDDRNDRNDNRRSMDVGPSLLGRAQSVGQISFDGESQSEQGSRERVSANSVSDSSVGGEAQVMQQMPPLNAMQQMPPPRVAAAA